MLEGSAAICACVAHDGRGVDGEEDSPLNCRRAGPRECSVSSSARGTRQSAVVSVQTRRCWQCCPRAPFLTAVLLAVQSELVLGCETAVQGHGAGVLSCRRQSVQLSRQQRVVRLSLPMMGTAPDAVGTALDEGECEGPGLLWAGAGGLVVVEEELVDHVPEQVVALEEVTAVARWRMSVVGGPDSIRPSGHGRSSVGMLARSRAGAVTVGGTPAASIAAVRRGGMPPSASGLCSGSCQSELLEGG